MQKKISNILVSGVLFVWILSCGTEKVNENNEIPAEETQNNLILSEPFESYALDIPEKDTTRFIQTWNSCTIHEPRNLASLNSGSRKFVYLIDRNNESILNIFGLANLKLGKKEKIVIIDYVEYKDTLCTPGSDQSDHRDIRLAAGVRLILKIKKIDSKIRADIPSKLAAASEFGLAETTFTIETLGFKNDHTRKILSDLGENFDVESYVKITDAVGAVMRSMQDEMLVNPVKIPVES